LFISRLLTEEQPSFKQRIQCCLLQSPIYKKTYLEWRARFSTPLPYTKNIRRRAFFLE